MEITREHDTSCAKSKDKCKCICLKCKNDHETCCFVKDLPCPLTECTRFAPETSEKQEREEGKTMNFVKSNESEESLMMCGRDFESREDGAYVEEEKEIITNYEELFGTPERAAKTMENRCNRSCVCDMCAYRYEVCTTHNDCIEGVAKFLNQEAAE